MGTDGEQLVLDYLSKVGDLAHSTSMSSVERRELVTQLRDEIGRKRSEVSGIESNADIKRILRRMGRPEEVVAAAGGAPDGDRAAPETPIGPEPEAPQPRTADPGTAEPVARARTAPGGQDRAARTAARPGPVPGARLAPEDLIDEDAPEWPSVPAQPRQHWPDGRIGGFVGGIEEPEMLRPPREDGGAATPGGPVPLGKPGDPAETPPAPGQPAADPAAPPGKQPREKREKRGKADKGEKEPRAGGGMLRRALGGRHTGGVVEFLAVLLLAAGAVAPSFYLLIGGWLLAYWSPRLSTRTGQWTVFGMPALVVGGYLTWLYGRVNGHWGESLEGDALRAAFADHYPSLLRLAGLASAAFLLWRAMRRPKG